MPMESRVVNESKYRHTLSRCFIPWHQCNERVERVSFWLSGRWLRRSVYRISAMSPLWSAIPSTCVANCNQTIWKPEPAFDLR